MKRKELLELYSALNNVANKGNIKFKIAIFKNLNQIEEVANFINNAEKEDVKILSGYQSDYTEILKKYGTQSNDMYVIEKTSPDYAKALKEIKKLDVTHKDSIALYEKKKKEFTEFMETEDEMVFIPFEIKEDLLPEDILGNELKKLIDHKIFILE